MKRLLPISIALVALLVAADAGAASASLEVSPTHGRSNERFTSTYTLEHESGCPAPQLIRFTWGTRQALLGTAPLQQSGNACSARLTAPPPAIDRDPGLYSVCGTYTGPAQETIVACADYRIDPGGPGSSPSPTPSGSPGGTPTGGPNGTPGSTGGGTASPGSTPGGSATPSPGSSSPGSPNSRKGGLPALPFVIGGAVLLAAASVMVEIRRRRR